LSEVRVTGWMADMPEEAELLADITGRPVHAFRLGSASAIGAALLSGRIDQEKHFAKAKTFLLKPSEQSQLYSEIYAKYVAQFPTTGGSSPDSLE